jgi:2-(1,2-epoxy-1,2-dihydrophenyl)acetyl-CoA isomerase
MTNELELVREGGIASITLNRVVPEAALEQESATLAEELVSSATNALGAARRLLLDSFTNTIETQMELESRAIAAQARTAEGREGIASFVEKRRPHFKRES